MLAEHDVRATEPVIEPVVDHRPRALAELPAGWTTSWSAGPGQVSGELGGGAEQAGDVHVVAARVADADVVAVGIDAQAVDA
ncbi:MAG: hypothetical protein U0R78_05440 [Nocardioidaceae bacterium]